MFDPQLLLIGIAVLFILATLGNAFFKHEDHSI